MLEDKIVFTVTHDIPYCVAVVMWLLEGCITQTTDDLEEFKEKQSTDKDRYLLNYETRDLVPTIRSSPDSINYRIISLKINFANVH